jgi:hypothetical protein
MVQYITRNDLGGISQRILSEERATIVRKAEKRSPAGSTFLSHSSKDAELLPAIIRILENHGAVVYVDKKDESLPPFTSRETARALRERVKQCRKFILLATQNSKDSKWMPWELGLSDGYKNALHTAIFPSVETEADTQWTTREYLGVYDRVVRGEFSGSSETVWMVWNNEKNTATELSKWLKE